MKRILIITGAIFGVLLLALIALPFLIPSSVYKTQIENAATSALGREVTLVGDPSLSIFPSISARIDGVTVANSEGFTDPLMIEAGSLKANVRLWPLFSQRVEINEFTLEDATVRLERLADGRANWEFGSDEEDTTQTETPESEGGFAAGIDRARLSNTAVYYTDRTTDTQYALTDFNASASVKALDRPLTSSGDGKVNGQAFEYDIRLETLAALSEALPVTLKASLGTDYGNVSYDGAVTLGDTPELEGRFDVSSDTIGQVLTVLGGGDLPINTGELKSIRANGSISGPASTAKLAFSDFTVKATGLDLTYAGDLTLGEAPILNGDVTLDAKNAERLLKPGDPLVQTLSVLGDVAFKAAVSGPATAPSLSGVVLKQRGQNLRSDYTGDISLSGNQAINGMLDISSDNPRGLLANLGTALEPGETLQNFALKGQTTGTAITPTLSGMTLTLDDTTATGDIGADLAGERPRITANLVTTTLDLTPFLGSGQQASNTEPDLNADWDDTPLDLASLKAVDATLTVAAQKIVLNQITLSDALLKTRLDNGRLSAIFRQDEDKPGFKAFNGDWSGDLVLDASRSTPTLQIEALADSIAAQEMLGSLTGFKSLSGLGDVHLDLTSEGQSLKALISGLDGKFESDLNEGALQGINLAKLVRDGSNLKDLIASGDLSITSFREAFSPEAETDFSNFIGNLSFTNGVANITDLKFDNPVVGVTGSGQIDLANRTIDIRLVPRLDTSAQGGGSTIGLANIPIPVRISGSWVAPSFGLDSSAVRAELTARARGEVASRITERVGGDVGNILGQIVGGDQPSPPAPAQTPDGEADEPEEPRSLEDELKDRAVDGALGAIFGTQREEAPAEEAPPE